MRGTEYKLKKLTIKGFKSISFDKPLDIEFNDINILLGANGAGKSNIVSFFKMLGFMMTEKLQAFIFQAGPGQRFLHYGSKHTPTLSAEIRFEKGKDCYDTYRFSLTHAAQDGLIINFEEIEYYNGDPNKKSYQRTLSSNFNESSLPSSQLDAAKFLWGLVSGCKVYQFSDSSTTSPMRQASTVESAHYLQSEANNLASFLYYLKNNYNGAYKKIVDYTRSVIPQFQDFYLEPENNYISLKWTDTSANDYVFSSNQLSDGSIRFIALATLLLQPKETIPHVILIDEPELGLHPYAIDQLVEMIKDASKRAQIVVSSQSPALLDGFDLNDITVIEHNGASSVARKLDSDEYTEWLKEYLPSELWNKNVLGGRP
ncbi:MAG: AAA family ATPase [Bacteroides sp.]|nr:AAA family ATPase [Bacteroides sp.]MCM1085362.1 AAA family ATPase [Bacteroides sp.]